MILPNIRINLTAPIEILGMNCLERNRYITEFMNNHFLGRSYYCPALGCNVVVTKKSIHETATHASKSVASTIAVINLPKIISSATFVKTDKPKIGTQRNRFKAVRMYTLEASISTFGIIKLTIAKTRTRIRVEYCITAKRKEY